MRSSFEIVNSESNDFVLVIRDLNGRVSVTNDAENVVKHLHANGLLPPDRRLHYYDSDGRKDGLGHKDGRFLDFYFLD